MIAGLSPLILTYSISIVLIAAIIRGYSGFGFVAIVVLALSMVLEPTEILPVLMMLEVMASIQMFPQGWKHLDKKRFIWLSLGASVGIPLGIYLLTITPSDTMKIIISSIIMLLALVLMLGIHFKDINRPQINSVVGLIFGLILGTTGVGGLALAAFFMAINLSPHQARAQMIVLFLLADIYFIFLANSHGLVNTETFTRTLIFAIPMGLGVAIGNRLFDLGSQKLFRRVILWILIFLSITSIIISI